MKSMNVFARVYVNECEHIFVPYAYTVKGVSEVRYESFLCLCLSLILST